MDGFRRGVRDATAADTHDDADAVDHDTQADHDSASDAARASRHEVAILDIARHAKPKGVFFCPRVPWYIHGADYLNV